MNKIMVLSLAMALSTYACAQMQDKETAVMVDVVCEATIECAEEIKHNHEAQESELVKSEGVEKVKPEAAAEEVVATTVVAVVAE